MSDVILSVIIIAAVGAATVRIIRQKKEGTACSGCSMGGGCSLKNRGECSGRCRDKKT